MRVYSVKGPYLALGTLGTTAALAYNESVHSTTISVTPGTGLGSFSSGTVPITIYSTQSTGGNMINIRDNCVMTLTVTYQESSIPSSGIVGKSSVEVGGSNTLYINSASTSNWHSVTWTLGSNTSQQNVSSGVTTSTFTIPSGWASAITGTSATALVSLSTYNSSNTFIGSNSYSFTVTLPANTTPTIGSVSVAHVRGDVPVGWDCYVQGKSKITLTINGASGSAGSTIASYRFVGAGYSWSSSTDTSYTTGFLTQSGTNTFTVTVTDTRGYSASKTVSIEVEPYDLPAVTSFNAYRSTNSGAATETGAYITFTITSTKSSVGGRNTMTVLVAFRKLGAASWSNNYIIPNDGGWVLPANIPATDTSPYELRVSLTDQLMNVTKYFEVAGTEYTMHFKKGGKNVSIGMAGNRDNALEISSGWQIFHGATDITPRLSGTLAIQDGGTGATTAANALTNLGAAPASHNHAATNINSGTLPVARGGTGVSALTASRALLTDASGNVSTGNTTSTQLGYLSNVTSDIQTQINNLKNNSGPKIAYGTTFVDGNTAVTISYSGTGFSYPPCISVTYSTTSANWAGDNGCIKVYNKTANSAQVIVGGSFPTGRQVDWIAIGQ